MACKMSRDVLCQLVQAHHVYVECSGESQDKAECPFWSGCLEKQTFIRPIKKG